MVGKGYAIKYIGLDIAIAHSMPILHAHCAVICHTLVGIAYAIARSMPRKAI